MGDTTFVAEGQLRTLDRLRDVPELAGFYLAGGTAVAFHVHHRRSFDLDLFSPGAEIDLDRVADALRAIAMDLEVIAQTDASLRLRLGGEAVDVVRYPYPPLEAPVKGPSGFPVASRRDLAVMKLAAIARRGIRRDFWDLRVLLDEGLSLREAARAYVLRYGVAESDLYHVARALTFFGDAEKEPAFPAGMTGPYWRELQAFFVAEAPSLLDL